MIIVCPNIDNSRGINSSNEYKEIQGKYGIVNLGLYEDYLIKEVIPFIDKNFNTVNDRKNRYIEIFCFYKIKRFCHFLS